MLLAAVGLVVFAYRTSKPRQLRAPLILALPDCKAGVYSRPTAKPVDLFDDVGNDAAKRACESTRAFQGEALLTGDRLILKIHNSDNSPLVLLHLRLILKPKYATSFQREYRLAGKVDPLSDGEFHVATNLDPETLEAFSAFVTWAYFEG